MERAKTTARLNVTTVCLYKIYATGRKYANNFKNTMKIVFDDHLPKMELPVRPDRNESRM